MAFLRQPNIFDMLQERQPSLSRNHALRHASLFDSEMFKSTLIFIATVHVPVCLSLLLPPPVAIEVSRNSCQTSLLFPVIQQPTQTLMGRPPAELQWLLTIGSVCCLVYLLSHKANISPRLSQTNKSVQVSGDYLCVWCVQCLSVSAGPQLFPKLKEVLITK